MTTFQVPQFIDIEDKIIGPLTLRQFLFLASAAVLIFILNSFLEFWLWIIISIFIAALGFAFAFLKFNGQYLPRVVWNGFKYLIRPRLYVWQRGIVKKPVFKPAQIKKEKPKETKRLSPEELSELAKKLNKE